MEAGDLKGKHILTGWHPPSPPVFHAGCHGHGIVRFYRICAPANIIHLTFSAASHQKALAWLRFAYPHSVLDADEPEPPCLAPIASYLAGRRENFLQPILSPFLDRGTDFQRRVWQKIAAIPYGETRTYGGLAWELGNRGYARAVGRACNTNPLALIIPCHRVVASHGLGGFAGGPAIKERLLALERKGITAAPFSAIPG